MRRKSLLCMVSMLALCTGLVMAGASDPVPVNIYDHTGTLITDSFVQVNNSAGQLVAKLPPASDGNYAVDSALRGQKITVQVVDPALGIFNSMDARIPEGIDDPVIITLPTPPPATPQQVDNDTCDTATPLVLPALAAGDTSAATLDPEGNGFCGTSISAPGVWYSVTGTGNPITASTCETEVPPGGANYDTKISVFCTNCGEEAICVGGNDDEAGSLCGGTFHSTFSWATEAGAEYLILVHGFSSSVGQFELSVFEDPGQPTDPLVACLPPPIVGACCIQDCNDPVFGHCEQLTSDDCAAASGEYVGDEVDCFIVDETTSYTNNEQIIIPDGTAEFVCTTIDVDDPDCEIADVDVGVNITHTWIGDLGIDVTGPGGATSNLWDHRCSSTINMDFFYDDEGTDSLCTIVALPGFGRGQPTVAGLGPALAQFDGGNPTGTWELCVNDTFPADSGTLNSWTLEIDCGHAACVFEGEPVPEPEPDGGHGHGHGHGGHGNGANVLGIEPFNLPADDGAIDPVIHLRSGGGAGEDGTDRGPSRAPAGDRLPR